MARLASLFDRALLLPRAARAAFASAACGGDDELRRELGSLLEAHESSGDYFDDLAKEVIAPASTALAAKADGDLRGELAAALEGRYRIERELGGGAMSRVFLAEEVELGRRVVIKVLPPELAATVSGERFRREIQLAARLQHPHIVPLLTAEAGGRLLYYTMPLVAGESLRERLLREGALPVADASRIWRDVLDALAYAHARGVVHRDVKPGNILLDERHALVADFGIAGAIEAAAGEAEATSPGLALGTPAYMAPEQVAGDPGADHRVDLYAAGLVMYEMLEGRAPFYGGSARDLLTARLSGAPAPIARAECPPALAALVMRCLARAPEERPGSADELLSALDALPVAAPRRRSWRRRSLAALAAMSAAVVALGVQAARRPPESAAAPASPPPSLAVLPLSNLSAAEEDAPLADGMTEELIAMLGREGALRVVASTSVRALQGRQLEARQIAESLRVTHLLEGALQKVGTRLRMQLRLVDAREGSTRWSATYDREIGDVFAVQDEIARAVAGELDVRLGAGQARSARRRPTPSIAAYEWYLRGVQAARSRGAGGRLQAVEYLQRAIAADSGFAAAYARLVWLYMNEGGDQPGDHWTWYRRAESAATKAVALDGELADAHSALGWSRLTNRDWAGAEAALTRAVALDPAAYRAYEGLARLYMLTGRPGEQLAAAQRGMDLDPYSIQAARELALAYNMNDRCDETLELLRPLMELDPPARVAGVIRGQCFARKEMWPEAIAEFRWAGVPGGARAAHGFLGYALARGGQEEEARRILSDLLEGRAHSHGAFGIALVYTGLRDYDRAFVWLEKAIEENSYRDYIMDPLFHDLHRDPRFDRLGVFGRPPRQNP